MAKIVLIHGFWNFRAGRDNIDLLEPYLTAKGHEVDTDSADYGFFGLFMVHFVGRKTIKRIAKAMENADLVVTHSNGANFAHKALKRLPDNTSTILHISPALNRGAKFPRAVREAWVFYTNSDLAVKFGALVPFSPWGRMGSDGPSRIDHRINKREFTGRIKGHSGWFKQRNLSVVSKRVHLVAEGAMT